MSMAEGYSKKPQVLQIEPAVELSFKGPFKEVVTSYLKLTNPSDKPVCFKVKTTAPKRYCVRPNSGIIPSKQNITVAVMLQPVDDGSTLDERSKHKFMVQTCFAPNESTPLDAIWKSVPPNELMDSKLRVAFQTDAAGDANTNEAFLATETSTNMQTASPVKSVSGNSDAELRKAIDDKKRLQNDIRNLQNQLDTAKERLAGALSSKSSGGSGEADSGAMALATWQLGALVAAVLAIGIAIGSLLF